jgi:hypothetical protein
MKKLLMITAACCVFATSSFAASPAEKTFPDSANPTKLPWKYQGTWCGTGDGPYHRPKTFDPNRPSKYDCEEPERSVDFLPDHWVDGKNRCLYKSFKRTKDYLEVVAQCPDWPAIKIRFSPDKVVVAGPVTPIPPNPIKDILGTWCNRDEKETSYYVRRSSDRECSLIIKSDSVEQYYEDGCKFKSITTRYGTEYQYEQHGPPVLRKKRVPVYEVKADCSGEGMFWKATLFFQLDDEYGTLNYRHYPDNEVPAIYHNHSFNFSKPNEPKCERTLTFEKDREST